MENLRKLIIERLKELQLGSTIAAKKVGLERGYIRDFIKGRKKTFAYDKLPSVASALDLDISVLIFAFKLDKSVSVPVVTHNFDKPNAKVIGRIDFDDKKRIPVYGQAVAGVDGDFALNGNVLFEVLCPPQLQKVNDAYGVIVSGDSMSPRYFDGEIVYIDPHRRLKRGDFVVAQILIDEHSIPHAFVKRFCKHNAEELVLEQFNPPKELRFPHDKVISVHFIALSGEPISHV
ncbi:putative phage repressor [Bartonella australis AUST/NH1]|uniref:Putative phage repressor n=1 Tax=Bartonella australis (strain Aust/NH1) TaxID=1094489 RepID=M1NZJ9_BARAA|nr:S24 family peptidase [Bartonella australis]AGF74852.1 putative phage repressor [Bartonella australis AUST/NH1]